MTKKRNAARRSHRRLPNILRAESLGGNRALIIFDTGKIAIVKLPIKRIRRMRLTSFGHGLDFGRALDMCACTLHKMRSQVLRPARRTRTRASSKRPAAG